MILSSTIPSQINPRVILSMNRARPSGPSNPMLIFHSPKWRPKMAILLRQKSVPWPMSREWSPLRWWLRLYLPSLSMSSQVTNSAKRSFLCPFMVQIWHQDWDWTILVMILRLELNSRPNFLLVRSRDYLLRNGLRQGKTKWNCKTKSKKT